MALNGEPSSSLNTTTTTTAKKNTVLISHGRQPWYGIDGRLLSDAFVIGIGGGSSSGKTTVARAIVEAMGSIPTVVIVSQDSFYKPHGPEELKLAFENKYDFDHPNSIDMPLFAECLTDLKACKQTNVPVYSFVQHQRLEETQYIYGAAIVIAEGIMALQDPALRATYDLKIFVQCDSDLMLARRIRRDVAERGRTVEGVLDQYLRFVKPAYDNFVLPSSKYADIIVPGAENSVAIDIIATHVKRKLAERGAHFRDRLAKPEMFLPKLECAEETVEESVKSLNLIVLPDAPQTQGIFTILRDKSTSKEDWIFYSDRLTTLLVERGSAQLPFKPHSVTTPTGTPVEGKVLAAHCVCGVSLVRSGTVLERGLRRVWQDVPLGTLLIQSDPSSGEPLLLHTMLPACLRSRCEAEKSWVFLLDSQIGTAAAAMMAIRVLLDHGVPQSHIIFLTFVVARKGGVRVLRKAFPHVHIVCGAVDEGLREARLPPADGEHKGRKIWMIEPGMGSIGDRYYL
ncbi:uridine kinase [Exidia glandulosa HHB12029]|uniref:Uridine kinase n=1 Tax=Exidia glandulosa HHB12029 TaxID=1314781 RepID=A0A165PW07_EXIGL|nr:uridine kinase [Exidia glandulosa HHB12029]